MGLLDTLKELLGMRDTYEVSKDDKLDSKDTASEFEQFSDANKDELDNEADITDWRDEADRNKVGKLSTDDIGAILNEKIDRK
jgi:hypothetical protein